MRLLIATDHFPPFIGGAHRWAELTAAGLARRGHQVTVATPWHGGTARAEDVGEPPYAVKRIRQVRTLASSRVPHGSQQHAPPFADPVSVVDLRKIIRHSQPEVVLSHGWISHSLVPALGRSRVPLALSSHDYGLFCARRDLLHDGRACSGPAPRKCITCASRFYGAGRGSSAVAGVLGSLPIARRRAEALQSVTTFVDDMNARHFLRGDGGRHVKRFVIPAFVEPDPPDESPRAREVVGQLPDVPFILFVGALRPLKGVEVLFTAYRQLHDPPPLVLMGTMERDTPDPFPTGATVFTDVPHAAVMEAWERCLFGVVPSVWPEPLGTVSVEGITKGKAVIGTVPTGMIDVLGEGAGLLVPAGDAGGLAQAMRSLIEDPSLRERLGSSGRKRSSRFQGEFVLDRYEEMLRSLVAEAAPRVRPRCGS